MQNISEGILEAIGHARVELLKISGVTAAKKERPESWSKKEILGHLIDSASNNHQRFIRGAQNLAGDFPTYNQDKWVAVANYDSLEWEKLVELFYHYNWLIAEVINFIPQEALSNPVNIGKDKPAALEFVITDYLRHLKHHIDKILG